MTENTNVIAFAKTIGKLFVKMPNKSHNKVPNAKSEYIDKEIPSVFLVCIVLMA
jgi:hypothetical protein